MKIYFWYNWKKKLKQNGTHIVLKLLETNIFFNFDYISSDASDLDFLLY